MQNSTDRTSKFKQILSLFDEPVIFNNQNGRNDRFAYAVAFRDGKKVFIKHAISDDAQGGFRREQQWSEFMLHVSSAYPGEYLSGPTILDIIGNDTIVFEYINAPQVAKSHDINKWQGNILRYARMLQVLDEASEGWLPVNVQDDMSRATNFYDAWTRWLGDNKSRVTRLAEARQLVEDALPRLERRMQHGDLTPWQIFEQGDNWVIYDGEKCGTDLLRYNDLAYSYGRLATNLRSIETSRSLLAQYLSQSGLSHDEFMQNFQPAALIRSVGMLSDAYRNALLGDDYIDEAEELMRICLDSPEALF